MASFIKRYFEHELIMTNKKFRSLIDRIIHRLMVDQTVDGFTDEEVLQVIDAAYYLLRKKGTLINMTVPLTIFGDIHGQFADLMRFLSIVGTPPKIKILFLGDYVDRCKKGLEVILLLFCFQIRYPSNVELLRGNHECSKMNRTYGFYEECRRKRSTLVWKAFQRAFKELPLCVKVNNHLFCMHGGISPSIDGWNSIKELKKPQKNEECDIGMAMDLMWADPNSDTCTKGWTQNTLRNASWLFGEDTVKDCIKKLGVDMIVRAHEVIKDGHLFYFNKTLCTVFSAPNYCGTDGNSASVMQINEKLEISFITLKPRLDVSRLNAEKLRELEKQNLKNDAKSPNSGQHFGPTIIPT